MEVDDLARHPRGVRAAQPQQVASRPLGRCLVAGSTGHPTSHHGHHEGGEPGENPRVWKPSDLRRQGRVDEDEAGGGVGPLCRLADRDQAPHRVADEDRQHADDLHEEAVQQPLVGLHRRRAGPAEGVAEPRQVEGYDPAGPGEHRSDRGPVQRRATQPVDAHEQRTVDRPVEVEVVHRSFEVDPPGLGEVRAPGHHCCHTVECRPGGDSGTARCGGPRTGQPRAAAQ